MNERKLLARLARGDVANVAFADLCSLAERLGFELRRVSGSHHIFMHPTSRSSSISNRSAEKRSRTRFVSS
jgi:predicted RNA binding protein YcfA (HicA-like mRNA interferase family)